MFLNLGRETDFYDSLSGSRPRAFPILFCETLASRLTWRGYTQHHPAILLAVGPGAVPPKYLRVFSFLFMRFAFAV